MTTDAAPPLPTLSIADDIRASGRIAGLDPAALATEFGTPLYAYDLDMIARRVAALRGALPRGFRLAYAVKANPALAVVAEMARLGVGADVASGGELATVLRAGFDPARIVMTGPGKRDDELAAAVAAGVGTVTVESPGELERLERAAADAGRRQPVLLRLAVGEGGPLESVQLIGGAGGRKFGMEFEALRSAAHRAAASSHLELLGVHAFGASNLTDADVLARHVAGTVAVGRLIAEETGVQLRLVDAGGGLGIPYADRDPILDLALLHERLAALRSVWNADPLLRDTEVLLEPGRYLVGPAGTYLASVVDVKGDAREPIAILDGGIHHAVRPALVRSEHRVRLLVAAADASDGRELVSALVAGPLCTGLDVFATAARIPAPRPGDLVALLDVGAYGFTESMPFFLSHPTPAEVAIRGGEARLIRPGLAPAELLERQVSPNW